MRKLLALGLLAVAVPTLGCGYALAGRGSYLPGHIKVVGIPPLENRTAVTRLDTALTDKLRAEFIGRGKFTPSNDANGADAIVRGEIVAFSRQTAALNAQQLASRYLVTVVLKVALIDAKSNEVLWSNDALTFRDEYQFGSASGGEATLLDQERGTMDRIATDISRTVVSAMLEAF